MQTQKYIDRAETVIWTHQLEFLIHRQITKMHGAEFSKRDMRSDRLRIFGVVLAGLELSAIWIPFSGARQRHLDGLARRSYDAYIKTSDCDFIAGFRHRVFCLGIKLRINIFEKFVRCGRRLNIGSMIDVLTDGNSFRQFCHSAEVVAMPMRDDEVVDLLQFGVFCSSYDALGVTNRSRSSGVSRINEKRLDLRC